MLTELLAEALRTAVKFELKSNEETTFTLHNPADGLNLAGYNIEIVKKWISWIC
jgi:hypothetical protein